ncbi:MAG: adenylate/guanylate cyclase domain-containing protein [Reyranella sp.]|uniref:adenylate/guanylate cyclase domain-containing protein n=1 Tax=Reyranella sp. TaxID=1929291 RepID=UPI0012237996|nr:adenylate/guanylate cyclase domain-containing protein [Reyranella sp.]TAJ36393.1 MAG: adenylate/guanylate cyclase domain-containing protein [Reyranella sp.]
MAREHRRLAAIVAADVVGYSRLMGRDESGTLARLREHRTERLEPAVARHGGRLVKLTGDGALIEFPSAVDALGAVIEFQHAMAEANQDQPEDTAIVFRIGLHLGDLIVDGDDLYGDGVNVAARLEAEAPPGGIVISGDVHNAVAGRLKANFDDLGSLALKNIERPVQAFGVKWDPADWTVKAPSTVAAPTLATPLADVPLKLPAKPSIAVLPFQNMSGDPEQEYFADGMAEDILTGLSHYRWLFVIARNSSFTYKGKAVDIRQVGRDLGVHYVLEGSVRRAGSRVRFTAQLIDTSSGNHVWADKYDGPIENLFELQDQITEAVVGVLEPAIQQAEIERTRRKRPENLNAYDHYLRSLTFTHAFTREAAQEMLEGCLHAISLDPSLAPAYALAARAYIQRLTQGWIVDEATEFAEVLDLVERGLRADRLDPFMLGTAGQCFAWFARDLSKGITYIDEAIAINPNYAHGFMQSGLVRARLGETRIAIDHLNRARRLSPRDLRNYAIFHGLALAHHVDGDPVAACDWARRSVQHNPNYLSGWIELASAAASTGREAEARMAAEHVLALDPAYTIGRGNRGIPNAAPEKYASIRQGLRLAGLPE